MRTTQSALSLWARQVGFVAVIAVLMSMAACDRGTPNTPAAKADTNASEPAPAKPSSEAVPETAPPAADASQSVDFQTLVGVWVRMDTPYVIQIKAAEDDGTLQAGYFNPQPINVARAEAKDKNKNGELEVFVELRDVNYPGSTYTLTYDRAKDLLQGVYYQATQQQSFDVAFRRQHAQH